MSMMKTNLTVIPVCPREHFVLYKSLSGLILCTKKDWATLLHLCYTCYLLLVTNYIITKLSVTVVDLSRQMSSLKGLSHGANASNLVA